MTILIISPHTNWSAKAVKAFDEHGIPCEVAHNGRVAQLMAYQKSYHYFILDLEIQNHPAIEVCLYLRKNNPNSKVVLTVASPKKLEELMLDEKRALRLGGSRLLYSPTHEEIVAEIHELSNVRSWKHLQKVPAETQKATVEDLPDRDFSRIEAGDLFENSVAAFDFYLRREPNKFIKAVHKGERISLSKFEVSRFVFFAKSNRNTFLSYQNDLSRDSLKESPADALKVIRAMKSATDKFFEEVAAQGVQKNLLEEGKAICQNLYDAALKNDSLKKFINDPTQFDPSALSHNFLTSVFTTLICTNVDWVGPKTVQTLALGALLHDIGIRDLPLELQDLDPALMNPEQIAIYQTHPALGAAALKSSYTLTVGVTQIVLQHHEHIDASGYPGKLAGNQIYPLAKIVSLADGFSCYLKEHELSAMEGLKTFLRDQNNLLWYDPILLKSLIKAIK